MGKLLKKQEEKRKDTHVYLTETNYNWLQEAVHKSGYTKHEIMNMALEDFAKKVELPGEEQENK